MKVRELIEILRKYPQELEVVYKLHSEQCLLEIDDIEIKALCIARPDGWVENYRPDKPYINYLVLPGN